MNSRQPRPLAGAIATVSALVGTLMLALYAFPSFQTATRSTALLASFIPYGIAAWLLAAVIVLVSARGFGRLYVLIPMVGLLLNASIIAPYFDTSHTAPAGTPATVRIMMLNLHFGQVSTDQLLQEVERTQPDIVVLTEFTEQDRATFTDPRWVALLPHHLGSVGRPGWGRNFGDPSGTHVLSRLPVQLLAQTFDTENTTLAVRVGGGDHQFVLVAAHPVNPVRGGVDGWVNEGSTLAQFVAGYADQPRVVVGDLNSVPEHLTVRNLLAAGNLHRATAGWTPTYPADRLVPLITIDQVLASDQFQTVSVQRFTVANTDHLGSVVELAQS